MRFHGVQLLRLVCNKVPGIFHYKYDACLTFYESSLYTEGKVSQYRIKNRCGTIAESGLDSQKGQRLSFPLVPRPTLWRTLQVEFLGASSLGKGLRHSADHLAPFNATNETFLEPSRMSVCYGVCRTGVTYYTQGRPALCTRLYVYLLCTNYIAVMFYYNCTVTFY